MRRLYIKTAVLLLFFIAFIGGKSYRAPLEIWFFDVGQGDSTFAKLPNGETLLIDAGNELDGLPIAVFLLKNGVREIDHFIITHPHEDHLGGADVVLELLRVKKIYTPTVYKDDIPNTLCYNNFISAAKNEDCGIRDIFAGSVLIDEESLSLYCISPTLGNKAVLNEYSAVLLLEFGSCRFLLAADSEKTNERDMLEKDVPECDLLRVAHHGSDTSSCKAFLEAVNPRFSIISLASYNPYGHPSGEVLQRLHSVGSEIYRTDLHGTLKVISDGKTLRISEQNISLDGDIK